MPSARGIQEAGNLRLDAAAAELISALDEAGIKSILLKGPSIARWLYDHDETRTYGDIDLLVSPARFADAEAVAEGLGFRHIKLGDSIEEASRHRTWYRQRDGAPVELHRSFPGIGVTDQEFWDALAEQAETLPLGVLDVSARIPSVPARALLVAMHATSHGLDSKAVDDLERALERLPIETWQAATGVARSLAAEPTFAAGLSLLPQGRDVADSLKLQPSPTTEMLLTFAPPGARGWDWFAKERGLVGKLRFVLRKITPSLDFMRVNDPIGQRGDLWLPLAYLVRPLRLAGRVPGGYRAWREAQRKALD